MTQTASSKDHFFSKSTEDEKHSEGELRSKCEKAPIDCMPDAEKGKIMLN